MIKQLRIIYIIIRDLLDHVSVLKDVDGLDFSLNCKYIKKISLSVLFSVISL